MTKPRITLEVQWLGRGSLSEQQRSAIDANFRDLALKSIAYLQIQDPLYLMNHDICRENAEATLAFIRKEILSLVCASEGWNVDIRQKSSTFEIVLSPAA
jgi:hypothetical protein